MKKSNSVFPTFDSMFIPTIQALQTLGGSGATEEIYEQVVQILNLSDDVLEILHGSTSQSEVKYRLSWSRTYLKKYGLVENSGRGVWSLVSRSVDVKKLDRKEIVRAVREAEKSKSIQTDSLEETVEPIEIIEELAWHQQLHKLLLSLDPSAFER